VWHIDNIIEIKFFSLQATCMKMADNHSTEAIKSHGKMYWASLVACMFIASTTGGVYAFGTYSGALKKQYGGFTQGELDRLGCPPTSSRGSRGALECCATAPVQS
jgi:hypothetical protein